MIEDSNYVPDLSRFDSEPTEVSYAELAHTPAEIQVEMLAARDYLATVMEQMDMDQRLLDLITKIDVNSFKVDENFTKSAAVGGSYHDTNTNSTKYFITFGKPLATHIYAFANSNIAAGIDRKLAEKIMIWFNLIHELVHIIQEMARYMHIPVTAKDVTNIGLAVNDLINAPDISNNLNSAPIMGKNIYGAEMQAQSIAMSLLVHWLKTDPVMQGFNNVDLSMLLSQFYLRSYPHSPKLFQLMYAKDLGFSGEQRTYSQIKQDIQARLTNLIPDETKRARVLGTFNIDRQIAYTLIDNDAGLEFLKTYSKTPELVDKILRPVS
jgi:hypothetical protein